MQISERSMSVYNFFDRDAVALGPLFGPPNSLPKSSYLPRSTYVGTRRRRRPAKSNSNNSKQQATMSGQYGDPDWANPSAPFSQQPVVESSSWTSTTGGEDFSGAAFTSGGAVAASNVNAAGLGNNASSR